MNTQLKNLIYGNSVLERITSIEPQGKLCEIFQEFADGSIKSHCVDNMYWLLASHPLDSHFNKLNGNLFYKYDKQYDNREDFLNDRKHYKTQSFSVYDDRESLMLIDGYTYYKGMKPEDVSVVAFDIETTGLDPNAKDAQVLLISNTYRSQGKVIHKLFSYDSYENEALMLLDWCKWIQIINPSIILGHNIFGFDLHYLNERATYHAIELSLGRDGSNLKKGTYEKKFRVDGSRDLGFYDFRIYGREISDTMHLAIRSDISRRYNSYGLKAIIKYEGWEQSNRTFYDASKIRTNYKDPIEWEKIKTYCKNDGDDALTLFDKFISPYFFMTQSVPKPFQLMLQSASGSQLNSILMRSYLQEGHSLPLAERENKFEGAISFGKAGIWKNCFKVDCISLYPSIILQYNIFNKYKDPNGNLLKMVDYFMTERLKNKQLAKETGDIYYSHLEQSQKIGINSIYGLLGTPGLAFNSLKDAALITQKGREILQQAIKWAKEKNLIVFGADTDSIIFCKQDQAFISNEERELLLNELNDTYPKYIKFSNDGYFSRVIYFKAKNYVLLSEDGKIKYKGSALRSPKLERALNEFIHRIVDAILTDQINFTDIYNEYVREIINITDINRWTNRGTISKKTLESDRTNESKIRDALEGSEYVEGDRIWVFFRSDDSLSLAENFNGDYNKQKLYEKLYKTSLRFSTVLSVSDLFINYKLKRNKKLLESV
jgi:DNA polymerase, archaea type